jgi:hypothetical protein
MKYETPKLTVLTTAINAIQSPNGELPKTPNPQVDSAIPREETIAAYTDWE